MKELLMICLVALLALNASGQGTQVSSAKISYDSYMTGGKDIKDLLAAKEAIDLASQHEKTGIEPKTWYYRGLIYTALAQLNDAQYSKDAWSQTLQAYNKTLELDTKGKYTTDVTNSLILIQNPIYTASFQQYQAGDYSAAYDGFKQCLAITELNNKVNKQSIVDTAIIQASTVAADLAGMKLEAKTGYEQLISLRFKDPSIYQSLARIYLEENNESKAAELLDMGMKLFPDNVGLLIESINILLSKNKGAEAKDKMVAALKLDPDNANLHFALGTIEEEQKEISKAEACYQKALALKPDYFDACYNLGSLYYNNAVEKVKEMNDLPLKDQINYDRLKGESTALFNKSLPFFEQANKLNGKDKNTLIALKEIYARMGKTDEYEVVKKSLDGL